MVPWRRDIVEMRMIECSKRGNGTVKCRHYTAGPRVTAETGILLDPENILLFGARPSITYV